MILIHEIQVCKLWIEINFQCMIRAGLALLK